MELEKQVTSVELSNKIKDLGVTAPSIFFRDFRGSKENEIEENPESSYNIDNVNCYTVAELGEMLPEREVTTYQHKAVWYCEYSMANVATKSGTEADARAKMLIYLLENELIKAE